MFILYHNSILSQAPPKHTTRRRGGWCGQVHRSTGSLVFNLYRHGVDVVCCLVGRLCWLELDFNRAT